MKLRKIIIVESISLVIVLSLIITFAEVVPFLRLSKQSASIGLYQEREYARGNVILAVGGRSSLMFTYLSYDPAILILDMVFLTWNSTGYLTLRCNNRIFASLFVQPENPHVSVTAVTVSGREWVKPPSTMFGLNEVAFESESGNGYAGTFNYKISIRGGR